MAKVKLLFVRIAVHNMPNGKGNVTQRMEYNCRRNYPKKKKLKSSSKSKAPKPLKSMK
jgi:hypothetical protein